MSEAVRKIREVIVVYRRRTKTNDKYILFRTLADAYKQLKLTKPGVDDYHSVWSVLKAEGVYKNREFIVEKKPIHGKHKEYRSRSNANKE